MQIQFLTEYWQSPDGQGTWFAQDKIIGKAGPEAAPQILGVIVEGDAEPDSWVVHLCDQSIDGAEYVGMAAAHHAVINHYARQAAQARAAAVAVQPA